VLTTAVHARSNGERNLRCPKEVQLKADNGRQTGGTYAGKAPAVTEGETFCSGKVHGKWPNTEANGRPGIKTEDPNRQETVWIRRKAGVRPEENGFSRPVQSQEVGAVPGEPCRKKKTVPSRERKGAKRKREGRCRMKGQKLYRETDKAKSFRSQKKIRWRVSAHHRDSRKKNNYVMPKCDNHTQITVNQG